MSNIFRPFAQLQGVLPLNIGAGELVDPVEYMGTRCDDSGRIYSMINTQIDHWANGLPFNVHGRLCVATSAVAYWDQGIPFTATDHVCIGNLPKTNWDQGLAFNAAGKIVHTTDANPSPPWVPLIQFTKDFTTDLTLEPFNTDHRDSWAMGADHEGIQRTVTDDVPVFIGARVVSNDVPDFDFWPLGVTTLTPLGDGFLVEGMTNSSGTSNLYFRPQRFGGVSISGKKVLFTCDIKAAESADIGSTVRIYVKRDGGGNLTQKPQVVTLASGWKRATVDITGAADNLGCLVNVYADAAVPVSRCHIRSPMVEYDTETPSSFIPQGTQHLTTANANTVDGNGIVTEATGPIILPVEGLQLEGSRTNKVPNTDLTGVEWNPSGGLVHHPSIKAPDGSLTAGWFTETLGAHTAHLTTGMAHAAGDIGSVWARALPGEAGVTVQLLEQNLTANVETLTEDWQRFEHARTIADNGSFYVVDNRELSTTATQMLLWLPQSEASTFSSSGIETPGDAVLRAETKFAAPFTDIPNLPDLGLTNDFCGQVVVDLTDYPDNAAGPRFLSMYDPPGQSRFVIWSDGSDRLYSLAVFNGGALITQLAMSAATPWAVRDFRFKLDGNVLTGWVDGVRFSKSFTFTGYSPPISVARLGTYLAGGLPGFGIYKYVRIVPEALSDADIEAWEDWT